MARALLHTLRMQVGVAILSSALGAGCLLPQESSILQDYTQPNRPPRILENTIEPARQSTIGNGLTCKVEFSAFVADPDIDDALTWRWYVDYDPEGNNRLPKEEGVLPPSGAEERNPSVKYTVTIQDNPSFPVGLHVVTLMVFDGHLLSFEGPGSIPPSETVPGTDAGNPHYSTTFNWVVTVDPNEACP
jgi:hypothetical protein